MGKQIETHGTTRDEPHVGQTLRELRKKKKISLQQLADASGVSVGMISQVERGVANPSVRVLTAIRRALNASMQELFGETKERVTRPNDPEFVRRSGDRPIIHLGDMTKELLTSGGRHHLQIMILKIEPGGETGGRANRYPADKGGMVLSGRVSLWVNDETSELQAGDSFVFDSALPHSLKNDSDELAEVLWIIGAIQFDRHL